MNKKLIKYTFRRNLGDYEHEELTIEAELEKGDDAQDCIDTLKEDVVKNLGDYRENDGKKKNAKLKKKKGKKGQDEETEEEDEVEEDESEESSDGDEDPEEAEDEDEDSEEEDESEEGVEDDERETSKKGKSGSKKYKKDAPKKRKGEGKAPRKGKLTPYASKNQLHKKLVGEVMDEKFPKWRKKESLVQKSLKASAKMEGEDFLDKEGDVVESFKKKFWGLVK